MRLFYWIRIRFSGTFVLLLALVDTWCGTDLSGLTIWRDGSPTSRALEKKIEQDAGAEIPREVIVAALDVLARVLSENVPGLRPEGAHTGPISFGALRASWVCFAIETAAGNKVAEVRATENVGSGMIQ